MTPAPFPGPGDPPSCRDKSLAGFVIDNHSHLHLNGSIGIRRGAVVERQIQRSLIPQMYICLCKAVRESDIQDAVNGGVKNMRQLAAHTGCSTNCGRCAPAAAEFLTESLREKENLLSFVSPDTA